MMIQENEGFSLTSVDIEQSMANKIEHYTKKVNKFFLPIFKKLDRSSFRQRNANDEY